MANTTYDTIKNMKPAPWSKSTIADGNALNQNFLEPTHQKDLTLAAAIDQVKNTVDGYNETINTINGIANNAKELATSAMSEINEVSTVVEEHQEALSTLNYNINSLSSSMVEVVTDIANLENNKQDKIYVDPTTIAGSGTQDSPYTVIGGGGNSKVYVPNVDDGNLSYTLSATSAAETQIGPWDIKGPKGEDGAKGNDATPLTAATATIAGGTQVTISYTSGGDPLAQFNVLSGASGQNGTNGTSVYLDNVSTVAGGIQVTLGWGTSDTSAFMIPSGAAGANGISPAVSITDAPTAQHPQGGKTVTITDADHPTGQSFDIWNGVDGAGATINLSGSNGIKVEREAGTSNYEISISSEFVKPPANTSEQGWIWFSKSPSIPGGASGWYDADRYLEEFLYKYYLERIVGINGISAGWVEENTDDLYFKIGINTTDMVASKQYAFTTSGWAEIQASTSLSLPLNIYNTTANTATNDSIGAIGNNCYANAKSFAISITGASAYSNSFAFGDANYAANNSMAAGWKVSASNESFAAGQEVSANNRSIAIGHGNPASQSDATVAHNYSIAVGDCVQAYDYSQAFGRGLIIHGNSNGKGCMAIGGWNSTTANALFVIGNGTGSTRSDAMVVDYSSNTTFNGSVAARVATGQNIIAVASAASLIGASRQTSANYGVNDNAMGTTWMGVGGPGMYRGFLKYTQGGNVGALDSDNTMQVEFTPNNKGTIFARAKNSGNDCPETQILNPVKTTCDNMATSGIDANNMSGPNYMIAKNADGQFVIGAAVFNCQGSLPGTLQPNTYYFVY